uniref:60S ribosomal protein L18a-like protein n=1 Tax=Kalanchoe fedtschenkoi TaxID=63787 RepID=A0A7N0VG29_KALFE
MSDEAKSKGFANPYPQPPPPPTFQGVATYPPPPPHAGGFPQPAPPPAAAYPPPPPPQYYPQPQPVPGYAMEEGRPAVERRHLCCGCGLGWVLFIMGFFFGAIPWYVGTLILIFSRRRLDYREKPGYVACAIAAVVGTIIIVISVSTGVIHR